MWLFQVFRISLAILALPRSLVVAKRGFVPIHATLLSSGSNASTLANASTSSPVRCGASVCKPLKSPCKKNHECVTDRCYDGKCGNGPTCRVAGDACRTYAAHTCCVGECQPVVLKHDCLRLLKQSGLDFGIGSGVIADRQCDTLGVCKAWPGSAIVGKLSTPWAVPFADIASKYWGQIGITFAKGVGVHTELFVARKVGQKYEDVDPSTLLPGSIRDAGVIHFTDDSKVATDSALGFTEGMVTFCVAPVVRGKWGGGYYAIGRDCCSQSGRDFTCGDLSSKKALVVEGQVEKYSGIAKRIEENFGTRFQSETKGLKVPRPIFVRFVEDPDAELMKPPGMYVYVFALPTTTCVAPIWDASKAPTGKVEFWAVGTDCCANTGKKQGFHCGAVDVKGARSGATVIDSTGDYAQAITMATVRWGLKMPPRPLALKWTADLLVPPPR